jgi:hypothetical protein
MTEVSPATGQKTAGLIEKETLAFQGLTRAVKKRILNIEFRRKEFYRFVLI